MSRGAPKAPITYEGEYDATRTYLPRQVMHVTAGDARTAYLSTATTTGVAPSADPTIWLPLGGGGDSEHNGTGTHSTAVGTTAVASGANSTAVGDDAVANAEEATAVGRHAQATGRYAVAIGADASASFAALASGDQSVAIGQFARATNVEAVAIGSGATAAGQAGVAISTNTAASGGGAIAIGINATASALRAIALGVNCNNSTAYTTKLKSDALEVEASSSPGGQTSVVLADGSGGRWRITATTGGALSVAAA